MVIFLLISLIVLMIIGIPIFVSLCLSSIMSVFLFMDAPIGITVQRIFSGIDKFSLMSVPFYIFAANIMIEGGMARRLLDWVNSLLSGFKGSLALATQAACTFFGALSGSSPATVVAIGSFMYPELVENKFGKGFSAGLISSSGAVAILIPPSITFIIYGATTGVSVGALFIAGIGAGIIYSLGIIAYSYYYVSRRDNLPEPKEFDTKNTWDLTKKAVWSLGVPVIILGGIFSGVFTPTEAAGVSVVYALIVSCLIYRELNLKKLYQVCIKSSITIAQIMILLGAASLFGWVLTSSFIPQTIAMNIVESISSKYIFLIIINFVFLILGMFIDPGAAVMIFAPLLFKPATDMGIDPVHLGVILVANLSIGMFSPPFGLNLFVSCSITDMSISDLAPAVIPFVIICFISLLVITYVPEVSMLLPRLAGF